MRTKYLILSLLFGFSALIAFGQSDIGLESLLKNIPSVKEAAQISDPAAFANEVRNSFVLQETALEEALLIINGILTSSAEKDQSSLEAIAKELTLQLEEQENKEEASFKLFESKISSFIAEAQIGPATSFEQYQSFLASQTAPYLMEYYYKNPDATKVKVWADFLKQTSGKVAQSSPKEEEKTEATVAKQQSKGIGILLLGLLNGLLLCFCVYLYLSKLNKSDLEKKLKEEQSRNKGQIDLFNSQIKALEETLKKASSKIEELEANQEDPTTEIEIEEEEKTSDEREVSEENKEQVQQVPIQVPVSTTPAPVLKSFFSSAPKNGMFFGRTLQSDFKAREHIYRIEIVDESLAYYYLVEDEATRRHAFNIPDSYILPAIELEGTGRLADASSINSSRGTLKKIGNNWQIEEKIVLQYRI